MRTRIKEFRNKKFRNKKGKVSFYVVQELCDDGVFRTINGGMCDTKEQAEKVRKSYKAVGKLVWQLNENYDGHAILHFPQVPTMRLSEER
jgi:hypothetical protein